jgi:cytochrome c-type biogenesis protein CcsB
VNTEAFAQLSNIAVASAAVVFFLAFLTHLAEWAAAREVRPARSEPVGAGARGATPGAPAPPHGDPGQVTRSDRLGGIGISLAVLATALLAAGVLFRGLAADRVPWGNMYEFAVASALVVAVVYVGLVARLGSSWLGPIVTGFVVIVLGLSILVYVPAGPLVPALDSYWLALHVSAAAIAGGAFVVGAGASALFLVKDRAERRSPGSGERGLLGRLPTTVAMDRLAYRVHAFAFPVWTFAALIAGPIWAQNAWGRYWGWDPKEVWAFITWVVYAGYLHARATAGWRGKGAAVLALIGFATLVFNFVGVNLFISGLHSYAF